jgi:hypothetical protein
MADTFFETYEQAASYAKQCAQKSGQPIKLERRNEEWVVYAPPFSQQPDSDSKPLPNPPPWFNDSFGQESSTQTTSVSGGKYVHYELSAIAPQKAKGKKNILGLSAAAAKRTSSKKGKRIFDPRSIFITEDIEPKEISGGLPSLGKRK